MWTEGSPALHFRVDGSGCQDVLLLHEIGGSLQSWDMVVDQAKPRFRFVRFDQRGFGLSEKPRAPYRLNQLAEDAGRVLEAAGVHGSFGICAAAGASAVAVGLASEMPSRVSWLVLCSPALELSEQARIQTRERANQVVTTGMASIVDQAMSRMFPLPLRNEGFADYRQRFLANDPVGFALANLALAEIELTLGGIECPVTILAGRHDVRPPEDVAQSAQAIRTLYFQIVESGGHVIPVQAPDAVALALTTLADRH